MFYPGLEIGEVISNAELVETFKCGNMGGMRRSHKTNTLVLISDYTKGLYHDKWIAGNLHYTGMGKVGDQDLYFAQNATVANSQKNGVDMHLFEVMDEGEYTYCGHVELVAMPYSDRQPDEYGNDRIVWMFPIRPVPENNVKKPELFTFISMEEYREKWKNAEIEYKRLREKKTGTTNGTNVSIKGKRIRHCTNGMGTVTKLENGILYVKFDEVGSKEFNYQMCIEKKLIEIV